MVGEVTGSSALVQIRLTQSNILIDRNIQGALGIVEVSLQTADGSGAALAKFAHAVARHDFIARVHFTGLTPNTSYRCHSKIGRNKNSLRAGPTAEFKTHPGRELSEPIKFVVVTGMNYAKFHGDNRINSKQHLVENNTKLPQPYAGSDKHLGYPALETILSLKPDFFVGTGDNVYHDTPKKPRATSVPEMR